MQHVTDRSLWRASVVSSLHLLGQAVARLPFGVPDPVLCGAAAVELYTGGLWSAAGLELLTAAARPLIAELFAVGFRCGRPGHAGGGLWHPELQIGIDIAEHRAAWGPAEFSNLLAVAIDQRFEGPTDGEPVSVKAVGIEDLITEQVAFSLTDGAPAGEIAARVRVLAALGQAGVGGRLRVGYLERRLAWETGGEVVLDARPCREDCEDVGTPRMIALSHMQAVINAWRLRSGFSFVRHPSQAARRRAISRERSIRDSNDDPGRAGDPSVGSANVVPLKGTASLLHCLD